MVFSRYVQSKDSSHLSPALGILACLCSGNYIVGKFLLASMTTDERKELYSCNFEDAKTRVGYIHTVQNPNFLSKKSTLISREKLFWVKTRENAAVLDFLAVDNFDFTRKM